VCCIGYLTFSRHCLAPTVSPPYRFTPDRFAPEIYLHYTTWLRNKYINFNQRQFSSRTRKFLWIIFSKYNFPFTWLTVFKSNFKKRPFPWQHRTFSMETSPNPRGPEKREVNVNSFNIKKIYHQVFVDNWSLKHLLYFEHSGCAVVLEKSRVF
jgi:hypothetical protein